MTHKNSHIIYINHILTYMLYITHLIKLIFKACKKTDKILFYYIFSYIKKISRMLSKTQRKTFNKGSWKVPKTFWRRKIQKTQNKIYLECKIKYWLSANFLFWIFIVCFRLLHKIIFFEYSFYRLVLEIKKKSKT